MDRLGPNRRAHLEHLLPETVSQTRSGNKALEVAENTWQRVGEFADANPDDLNAAALEAAAKEGVRSASKAVVETKMLQGELEDELFATGEEADEWFQRHQ
ncbi:hypothetical protein [Aliiroseovarius crassostreae]|uniref:hypothetical protein n=1 Tax=Aliiroseovarius crassostreae TaxID=154981 RepID=UPI00220A67D8|nr:hypothetical protein [Aliiroseovarius crassostreae]UWQ03606.1 hypothetical protein K3X22_07670 [Aliiroseovarius crassostreae]